MRLPDSVRLSLSDFASFARRVPSGIFRVLFGPFRIARLKGGERPRGREESSGWLDCWESGHREVRGRRTLPRSALRAQRLASVARHRPSAVSRRVGPCAEQESSLLPWCLATGGNLPSRGGRMR